MMMDLFVDTKYALLLKCYTNVKKSTFVFSIMLQNCNYLTPVQKFYFILDKNEQEYAKKKNIYFTYLTNVKENKVCFMFSK